MKRILISVVVLIMTTAWFATPQMPTLISGAGLGANSFSGPQTLPAGTTGAPSLVLTGVTGGWYASSNLWTFTGNAISNTLSIQNGAAQLNNASVWCWSSSTNSVNACDTALARDTAGVVQINNGTTGAGGGLKIPALKSTTGTRYVCTDTAGNFTASTTACSGT